MSTRGAEPCRSGAVQVHRVEQVDLARSLDVDDIAVVAAPITVGERLVRLRPR